MKIFEEQILKAIEEKIFPGAALLVASRGNVLYREFFGSATLIPHPEPVTEGTLFDIASLTKPVATGALTLVSEREKGLSLNAAVSKYLPDLQQDEAKKKITIRHLLKHTSGLPAWKPYFEEIAREHPEVIGKKEGRRYYVEKISQESLEMPVAFQRIYSDLGFILLGILLEDLWQTSLDRLFIEKISGPFEMRDTFYLPVGAKLPRPYQSFAATEESTWRNKLIRGEVHDDNAFMLGGVAGHSGLFSTVDDLHRFLSAEEFVGSKVKFKAGWDTPSPEGSQAGDRFSKNSIGHLGYTGCSFWRDLDQDFHVILLTNRVHPSSRNEEIKRFRPLLHNLIYDEILKQVS